MADLASKERVSDVARASAPDDREKLREKIRLRSFRCDRTFRLASGGESNIYFNLKPTMMDAEASDLLASLIHDRLAPERFDYVGGLELGAVPLVSVVTGRSFRAGSPIQGFIVRKRLKEHGTKVLIEGLAEDESLQGKRVAILEDVCTRGGSAAQAIDEVEQAGGQVGLVLAVVDREEGAARLFRERDVRFDALFRAHEFIPAGFARRPPALP